MELFQEYFFVEIALFCEYSMTSSIANDRKILKIFYTISREILFSHLRRAQPFHYSNLQITKRSVK